MKRRTVLIIASLSAILFLAGTLGFTSSGKIDETRPRGSELIDKDNKPVDFSRFKGKVVFVNNWATWCAPCVAEMPTIQEMKSKVNSADLVFVMVSFDESQNKALSFMKQKNYEFEVYFPGEKYPFQTTSIPATFIIEKNGEVIGPHVGMTDYSDQKFVDLVNGLLKQK